MDTQRARELSVAEAIARKAGELMRRYFEGDQRVRTKSDHTPVTIADTKINAMVIEELARAFPNDGVIGEEESTAEYGSGRRWVCDPIDGTKAFVWGVPTAMFSLGLVADGTPVMGVAYDPFLDKLYSAARGQGSFCNGTRLCVSTSGIGQSHIAITSSVLRIPELSYLRELETRGAYLATFSGAVYKACLVARGRFAAYIEEGVSAHDLAAAHVIVEEAGGRLSDMSGHPLHYDRPFTGAIVSNGVVHEEVVRIAQRSLAD